MDVKTASLLIIGLLIAALLVAHLMPVAIEEIEGTDVSNWSDGAAGIWNVISILILVVVLAMFAAMIYVTLR